MKKQIMVWLMILSVLSLVNIGWAVVHEDGHTVGEPRDTLKVLPIPGYTGRYRANGVPEVNGPAKGEQRCLVILVKFPDQKNSFLHTPSSYRKLLFETSNDKSMATYYAEVSYGKISVTGTIAGDRWLTSAQNYVYYGGDDDGNPEHGDIDNISDTDGDGQIKDDAQGNPPDLPPEFNGRYSYVGVLAKEALALADPYVDYSVYDTNGDKHITPDELHLIIIHAGRDQAQSLLGKETDIWSHRYQTPGWQEHDGVNLAYYVMGAETSQMGTFAHEFGHDLGLPDLYDTTGASEGIGNWGLMGAGSHLGGGKTPAHLCAWSKAQLEWVNPIEITSGRTQLIDQVETQPIVYKLWKNGNYSGKEYFLIENRQKVGFDAKLPGPGLLIWHIDDSKLNNGNNDDVNHKLVDLEEADETESHDSDLDHNRNRGDDGDPWPGITVDRFFNDTSFPNSKDYSSNPTFVAVENISNSGTVMTAELRVSEGADSLSLSGTSHSPSTITPGQIAVIVEQLDLSVQQGENADGTITLTMLKLNQTGTAADSDITTVKLLASDQTTLIASSTFTSGTATFSNLNRQITAANPDTLYLALDVAATVTAGKTIKLEIPDSTYLAVNAPDTVSTAGFPIASGVATVVPPGGWPSDPTVNVPICTASGDQYVTQPVSDGTGGAIMAWTDHRSSSSSWDIYAQRVDAGGNVLWTIDGVPVCTAPDIQYTLQMVMDGAGGAIITWYDNRNGNPDIYAQRVNASGAVLWTINGIPICMAASSQEKHQLVSDGAGGAIIAWEDYRNSSSSSDIYAQRVDAKGTVLWTIDGMPICTVSTSQSYPQLVNDGAGGAIITWNDFRIGISTSDIYAQHVDASGNALWTTDGVPICTAADSQTYPQLVNDGAGGAIITWADFRIGIWDIYAQRVDASGSVLWTINGVPICTASGDQYSQQAVSDGAGGAIITWQDGRSSFYWDIYAQRVNANGKSLWITDGVFISSPGGTIGPQLVNDGVNGAILTWNSNSGLYAQRVNSSGAVLWTSNGTPICTLLYGHVPLLVSDGASGAIIAWADYRSGNNYDIYAQNVNPDGTLGGISGTGLSALAAAPIRPVVHITPQPLKAEPQPIPLITRTFQNYPNPFNPETWLPYQLADDAPVTLKIYSLNGRLVRTLALGVQKAGVYVTRDKAAYWDGRDDAGERVSSGVYFYTLRAGEFVATRKMLVVK
ncbi:M6 family metalloprotease domain-containing protein [Candidatus Poribacteria bacterium]|nr:M6 family metalloprotease domain-containing protein [Candidatus Poribacteria bacterium]